MRYVREVAIDVRRASHADEHVAIQGVRDGQPNVDVEQVENPLWWPGLRRVVDVVGDDGDGIGLDAIERHVEVSVVIALDRRGETDRAGAEQHAEGGERQQRPDHQ